MRRPSPVRARTCLNGHPGEPSGPVPVRSPRQAAAGPRPVPIDLDTADQTDRLPPTPAVGKDPLTPHNWSADDTLDLTSAIIALDQELRTRRPDLTIAVWPSPSGHRRLTIAA